MPYDEAKHFAMVEKALDAVPGYPFLPCPICRKSEGCDHTEIERAIAYEEKVKREPRPYDLTNPEELRRLYREAAGYLHVCRRCGGDFDGRRFSNDALNQLAKQ